LDKQAAAADEASSGRQRQCSSRRHCGNWMAGHRLWRIRHACTTTVAHCNTRWQTKARARRRVVIWLTSDLTSMCVGADQQHSPLMGEHRLGCSTPLIFYHGKRSHALVTQCVRVRACKNPRHGREETRWRLFVPTDRDMAPCYRNSPMQTKSKDQERTRNALQRSGWDACASGPVMALGVAKAHANKFRANGHHTPSSDRSTPNTPGRGPGRTRSHFHCTHLLPFVEEAAHFRIDMSTSCFTLVFYKAQPVGLNMFCHVLQLLYTSFVYMLFYMDHKDPCEYIISYIQTNKPQPARTHFFPHSYPLSLYVRPHSLYLSHPLPAPLFCLSFFLSFFLSHDSILYITYLDEVTRLMRLVRCAATRYCACHLFSFRFWRHQKGRQLCIQIAP